MWPLRRCSVFQDGFLQPTTRIEDRRSEISPLLEWRFSSRRTMVQGLRGIFALSRNYPHWSLLRWVSHKGPWSSRCSLWWTYPFVGYYSTLGGVQASLQLYWRRISSWDYPELLSAFWLLQCSQACGHDHTSPSNTFLDSPLAPMLSSRHSCGRFDFLKLLRCSFNSLGRQGIGASCTPKMQSCFYLDFR